MIGIIGGYGDVGLQAARILKEWGRRPLRFGGRNPKAARAELAAEFPLAEWVKVDIDDSRSLEAFLDGCELVINCAGPSYRKAARVAEMCVAKGCHQVDAGTGPKLDSLRTTPSRVVILYAAGAIPGLSGLLPRWLAQFFTKVDSLRCYTGFLGRFTASAAADYLAGMGNRDCQALAAWKNGARRLAALRRETGVALPFFPREVSLYPYFDPEAEFVATSLALRDGEWYLAVDGDRTPAVLEEAAARFPHDRKGAVERLRAAAALDAAGRRSYLNLLIQISGIKDGVPATRTLVLQAGRPGHLTGSVVAATGIAVLEGELSCGIGPLAEIFDPDPVLDRLRRVGYQEYLQVLNYPLAKLRRVVEGAI
jgi:hypothetical protein